MNTTLADNNEILPDNDGVLADTAEGVHGCEIVHRGRRLHCRLFLGEERDEGKKTGVLMEKSLCNEKDPFTK